MKYKRLKNNNNKINLLHDPNHTIKTKYKM